MEKEQNTLETKDDKNQKNLEQDPKTLETGTAQETKDANKTLSSKNEKIKKKRKPQLTIESRNSSNGFYNKYRNTSRTETNIHNRHFFSKTMQAEARECHKRFKECGQKSLHVLDRNIRNVRYPGFSEFFSSNVLQNSSYCWSFCKDARIKDKSYKKYNDNIYNLPDLKSARYTIQGYGSRGDSWVPLGKGDPSPDRYNILSVFDVNIKKKKGSSLGDRLNYHNRDDKYKPGPGTYEDKSFYKFGNIPILIKSRQRFFYDDDLKKKKATVSMQRYRPNYNLVERRRFNAITFGIGDRPNMNTENKFPGPGAYKVPGNFDRGYRGKLPLN